MSFTSDMQHVQVLLEMQNQTEALQGIQKALERIACAQERPVLMEKLSQAVMSQGIVTEVKTNDI